MVLKYLGKISTLVKTCDVLYKTRYIVWVPTLLGACDGLQDRHHLGFYPKLEIIKKRRKLKHFGAYKLHLA